MLDVCVSSSDRVLGAAIAALVREVAPAANVTCGDESDGHEHGVTVTFRDSGRWLFVAASAHPNSATAEALARGASAVTTLRTPLAEFAFAIRSLAAGGPGHVPLDVVRWMAGEALERAQPAVVQPPLTAREREILQLVARGYTNAEIAEQLLISTNTVRTHLHALSVKLEATNRTRMLANARALAIPEALDTGDPPEIRASA